MVLGHSVQVIDTWMSNKSEMLSACHGRTSPRLTRSGRGAGPAPPHRAIQFQRWCMTGLASAFGLAGEAPRDGAADHETTSAAGCRYPSVKCGRILQWWRRQLSITIFTSARHLQNNEPQITLRARSPTSNCTGCRVLLCVMVTRSRTTPPTTRPETLRRTRSHPRSLLSIARLKRARSRRLPDSSSQTRMAQTCLGRRGRLGEEDRPGTARFAKHGANDPAITPGCSNSLR